MCSIHLLLQTSPLEAEEVDSKVWFLLMGAFIILNRARIQRLPGPPGYTIAADADHYATVSPVKESEVWRTQTRIPGAAALKGVGAGANSNVGA